MTLALNDNHQRSIELWIRTWSIALWCFVMIVGVNDNGLVWAENLASQGSSRDSILIEDFRNPDERGFPQGWGAQRSTVTASIH